jgi:hypothetical protein
MKLMMVNGGSVGGRRECSRMEECSGLQGVLEDGVC